MKKRFLALGLAFFLLWASLGLAFQPSEWTTQSATYTSDQSITTKAGYFYGIAIDSGVTTEVTFDVYDSGVTVTSTWILPSFGVQSGTSEPTCIFLPYPIAYNSGIYVDVTTTGGGVNYKIYYRERQH